MPPKKKLCPSVKTEIGLEWRRRYVQPSSGPPNRGDPPPGDNGSNPPPGNQQQQNAPLLPNPPPNPLTPTKPPSPPPPRSPPPPPPPGDPASQVAQRVIVSGTSRRRKREDYDPYPDAVFHIRRVPVPDLASIAQPQQAVVAVGGSGEEITVLQARLNVSARQRGGRQQAGSAQQTGGILARFGLSNLVGNAAQGIAALINAGENSENKLVKGVKIALRATGGDGRRLVSIEPGKAPEIGKPPEHAKTPEPKKAPEGSKPAEQTAPSQSGGQSSQESDVAARKRFWLQDLESIRRDTPLAPIDSKVLEVTAKKASSTSSNKKDKSKAGSEVLDLTGDSPTKSGGEDDEPPSFYGLSDAKSLIFQDRKNGKGLIPPTGTAVTATAKTARLLMDEFRAKYKIQSDLTQDQYSREQRASSDLYHPKKGYPRDHEAAHKAVYETDFAPDQHKNRIPLIRGLPLVEEVSFLRVFNYEGAPGECFWKAVAFHIYGDWRHYLRVKAEHLTHFAQVLDEQDHPRYDAYQRLNQTWYKTKTSPKRDMAVTDTVANFFQVLCIPGIYAPLEMFSVTADLYGVFIIIYTMTENKEISFVTTRGSYNSRHLFVLFANGNHFQPLLPNEFWASEFRLPMITLDNTLGYPGAPPINTKRRKDSIAHPWRKGHLKEVAPLMFVDNVVTGDGELIAKYGIGVKTNGQESTIG